MITFAKRTGWNLAQTSFARAVERYRLQGRGVIDLTASNPTVCGFAYATERITGALANVDGFLYEPEARGLASARRAVAAYTSEPSARGGRSSGEEVDPERIFLTTSTSEAYGILFRLLCEVGDEVMIAQPSYPLFEFLADLSDVRLVEFPYFYDHGWHVDLATLEERITPRCRAILLVHPNNPTGHFIQEREQVAIEEICLRHELSLIVDEVFLDYGLDGRPGKSFAGGKNRVLTFVLSGLSKVAGLPQMKVAWILCGGPEVALTEAMKRLEVIADTYLSVNTPMQVALPQWLEDRGDLQAQICGRVRENLAQLDRVLEGGMVSRLMVEAGWYAVLRVPALDEDESAAIALLEQTGVLVHPGHFYGFQGNGWMVLSLLPESEVFGEGVRRLVEFFHRV